MLRWHIMSNRNCKTNNCLVGIELNKATKTSLPFWICKASLFLFDTSLLPFHNFIFIPNFKKKSINYCGKNYFLNKLIHRKTSKMWLSLGLSRIFKQFLVLLQLIGIFYHIYVGLTYKQREFYNIYIYIFMMYFQMYHILKV